MDDDVCSCAACRLSRRLADPTTREQLHELAAAIATPDAWSTAELGPAPDDAPAPTTHRLAPSEDPPAPARATPAEDSTTHTNRCTDPDTTPCACPPSPAHRHHRRG